MKNIVAPSFSIVVPSFNQGHYISLAIDSILAQEVSCEIIVVDGLSTDITLGQLEPYRDHIQLIREPDKGQYDAINKGFDLASGKYHAWLNSDDRYMPGALRFVQDLFENNPGLEWLTGGILREYNEHSTDGGLQSPSSVQYLSALPPKGLTHRSLDRKDFLLAKAIIHQSSTFWRSTLSNKCVPAHATGKLLDQLHYAMDFEFWVRLSKEAKCRSISQILSVNIVHSKAKTGLEQGMSAYNSEVDSIRYRYFSEWIVRSGFQSIVSFIPVSAFKSADRLFVRLLNGFNR